MKEMWDSRYANKEYAYGTLPNEFFRESLDKYKPTGKILMPAEGEGRNAVFAAKSGLDVTAFDISIEGKNKALKLADQENVTIDYQVGDFYELKLVDVRYDAAALIYAHFPPSLLSKYFRKIAELIKPDGMIILEGFSKNHIKYQEKYPNIGGPKTLDFLFSKESIQADFADFEIIQLEEVEVALNEGLYHNGVGSVIRFIGKKVV
ncbi:MAG: SAM-dependent methyltransferase [Marinoscillum sp.]|jgi:SAM-dependent methyltransferase